MVEFLHPCYLWRNTAGKDIMDSTAAPVTLHKNGQVSGCFGFAEGKLFVEIHNVINLLPPPLLQPRDTKFPFLQKYFCQ